jgi:hypothetical protein
MRSGLSPSAEAGQSPAPLKKEADSAEQERMRGEMPERYRTLLGHFRHESGHYYWDRLIRDTTYLDECRSLFGDDTLDYGVALEQHYQQGAPPDWQDKFISSYATMHPWEDWAETWAHYLHVEYPCTPLH